MTKEEQNDCFIMARMPNFDIVLELCSFLPNLINNLTWLEETA